MANRSTIVARAVGVMGVTAALATGVTWAALTSNTATLTDSSINSTTASLKLWDGDSYENSAPGFTINGLVPGQGSAPQAFYFQNQGATPLTLSAHVPGAPTATGFSGWENLKVKITKGSDGEVTNTTMKALLEGNVVLNGAPLGGGDTGDSGNPTAPGNYTVVFDIDPSAVTGSQATVGNFNLDFVGVQPGEPTPTPTVEPTATPTPGA